MAASANPSPNQEGGSNGSSSIHGGGATAVGSAGTPDNSDPSQTLKHNPGLAIEWSAEEQTILEDGLSKYASDSVVVRYAKIAKQLHGKTVRDVALRCRWMSKKGSTKRKKDDHNQNRKINKKGGSDSSSKPSTHMGARPGPPYPLPPIADDDDISYKVIGGQTGQLLEQNSQVFQQISQNLAHFQIQENINLFCQMRDNILNILNDIKDVPEIMKQMPPLPVKVNEELANSILPRTSTPNQS